MYGLGASQTYAGLSVPSQLSGRQKDPGRSVRIGLIADTHGLVRPEALRALSGSDLILHAGDVGGRTVLAALSAVARVWAVYGNVDAPELGLAAAIDSEWEGVRVHVSHGHEVGSPTPDTPAARYDADV